MEESGSFRAHRDDLLDSIERWRSGLEGPPTGLTTYWRGVGGGAADRVAVMIARAVAELAPDWVRPDRATMGQYVGALERAGASLRAECTRRPGRLLRPTEVRLLNRLTRLRAAIAHVEERAFDIAPGEVGRLGAEEVSRFLDAAEEFCRLQLVDEVICREAARGPRPGNPTASPVETEEPR